MRLPYALLATISAAALTGCVSMKDLNGALTKRFGDIPATGEAMAEVERDPCPDTLIETTEALVRRDQRRSAPLTLEASLNLDSLSDLELGRQIISGSYVPKGRKAAALDRISDAFGIELAPFADQLDALDEGGANLAEEALKSPAITSVLDAHSRASLSRTAENETVRVNRVDWRKLEELVSRTTTSQGWTSAFVRAFGARARARLSGRTALDSKAEQQAWIDLDRKSLLAAYFIAYFRNGKIIELTLSDDGARARLKAEFRKRITDTAVLSTLDANIDALSGSLVSAICPSGASERCLTLGTLGEETFVTRAGKSIGFPGISATIDLFAEKKISTNKIDEDAVIGDLIRVLAEAVGDIAWGIPGTPNSTMCKTLKDYCTEAKPDDIAKASNAGDRTEAAVATATGIAIRGGWLFSLNNEALAKWIQTGVSVSFRKGAEYVAWKRRNTCSERILPDRYASVRLAFQPDKPARGNRNSF